MKNVCFTGHRHIEFTRMLIKDLTNTVETLIKNGATDFYAGCAEGFDLLCEVVVLMFRSEYPHIRLHLVLPENQEAQVAKWDFFSRKTYEWVTQLVSSAEVSPDYKSRNQRLVDCADICVCYYNEKDFRSGTGQTVRMAKKKNIKVLNLFE